MTSLIGYFAAPRPDSIRCVCARWSVPWLETVCTDIEGLALGRRFDAVVLGSHMVNTGDDAQRHAFLRTCRDHVADGGIVLLERHAGNGAETARNGDSRQGDVTIALRDVRRHPPFVSAVAEYRGEAVGPPQPSISSSPGPRPPSGAQAAPVEPSPMDDLLLSCSSTTSAERSAEHGQLTGTAGGRSPAPRRSAGA